MPGMLKPGALSHFKPTATTAENKAPSHGYQTMPVGGSTSFNDKWSDMFAPSPSAPFQQFGHSFHKDLLFVPGKRKRINLTAIIVNLLVPWFLFSSVFMLVSFHFHYDHNFELWLIVFCCFLLILVVGFLAQKARARLNRTPMWFAFAGISMTVALTLAVVLGCMNYWTNMLPTYKIKSLHNYASIDPAVESSMRVMDIGQAHFAEGTHLDFKKGMGFMNGDMYCVVPITMEGEELPSYDYWAVGINCCSGTSADFRCGEFNNPKARSGMRLMDDDSRAFFRLAVQEAEAMYKIKAPHPLFFHWMQDPVGKLDESVNKGWRYFLMGTFTHLALNTFSVLVAVLGFSKLGY